MIAEIKKKSIDDLEYNLRHSQSGRKLQRSSKRERRGKKMQGLPARRFDNGLMEVSEKRGNKGEK